MVTKEKIQTKKPTHCTIIINCLKKKCVDSSAHGLPRIFGTDLLGIRIIWSIIFSIGIVGAITIELIYGNQLLASNGLDSPAGRTRRGQLAIERRLVKNCGVRHHFFTNRTAGYWNALDPAIFMSLTTYFSYPFSTSVSIYETNLDDFPAITFCNLNSFNTSDENTANVLNKTLSENNLTLEINSSEESPAINEVQRSYKLLASNILNDLFLRIITGRATTETSKFEDLVFSCYFNGQKCDLRDFKRFYIFGFSQCFTFNKKFNSSTVIKKTSKTGPKSGLMLEIFTGHPGQQDLFVEKRGLYLAVHNNSAYPAINFEGIKLPVGTSAEIGIKRTFYRKLSEPFSKCRKDTFQVLSDDPEIYKRTVKSGVYTRKICFEICLLFKYIIPKCNCSDPRIQSSALNVHFCKTFKELDCIEEVRKQFDSEDLSLTCDKECPISCDTMKYTYQQSYSDYPTQYYYEVIKKQDNVKNKFENLTFDSFKQSTLMVNVFYQELSSTFVEETRLIRPFDLVASIGGLVGLFLGCSVLTLMEPISFIIELAYRLIWETYQTNPSQAEV
ncbi:amiloride-sensitive sodium channel subunit gamma [Brachionus plicatilis]|uniref:Amiloride-sensitive sodium channel subunit gamma n=1 Tax=Brachionus plicatilis TaxID=10195 RepID=A0A3M7SQ40_BRAPC|nr:amiloride-sensitive sodium channel subunit gamma [Brachionus plicatilis]